MLPCILSLISLYICTHTDTHTHTQKYLHTPTTGFETLGVSGLAFKAPPTQTNMACSININMFNPAADPQHQMSPRISFSNDFVVDPAPAPSGPRQLSLSDPDFEFSVGTRPMMAADELFFKGRMLPLRGGGDHHNHNHNHNHQRVTLRDELRAQDGDPAWDSARPPKGSGSIRWKELLGLKKANNCANAAGSRRSEQKASDASAAAQEQRPDGGARAKHVEMDDQS